MPPRTESIFEKIRAFTRWLVEPDECTEPTLHAVRYACVPLQRSVVHAAFAGEHDQGARAVRG